MTIVPGSLVMLRWSAPSRVALWSRPTPASSDSGILYHDEVCVVVGSLHRESMQTVMVLRSCESVFGWAYARWFERIA